MVDNQRVGVFEGFVRPDYRCFVVRDAEAYGDPALQALEASSGRVAGSHRECLVVQCVDDRVHPYLRVEVFTDQPPPSPSPWRHGPVLPVEVPSGALTVDQGTVGPWPQLTAGPLPAGPGRYRVSVDHQGRDELWPLVVEASERTQDTSPADTREAFARLAGTERYLLRIWPDRHEDAS